MYTFVHGHNLNCNIGQALGNLPRQGQWCISSATTPAACHIQCLDQTPQGLSAHRLRLGDTHNNVVAECQLSLTIASSTTAR